MLQAFPEISLLLVCVISICYCRSQILRFISWYWVKMRYQLHALAVVALAKYVSVRTKRRTAFLETQVAHMVKKLPAFL